MKKKMISRSNSPKIQSHSKRTVTLVFFSIVLLSILVTTSYLTFFSHSATIQFSPDGEGAGFSYENARSLVIALGNEGISWYCGKTATFEDSQGNSYGAKELAELKRVLGHAEDLEKELCE